MTYLKLVMVASLSLLILNLKLSHSVLQLLNINISLPCIEYLN